jgi:hypothetical protein
MGVSQLGFSRLRSMRPRGNMPKYENEHTVTVTPAVLGSELMGVDDDQAPTVLYLPTAAPLRGEDEVALVLRELDTNQLALLVFTSPEMLQRGCGNEQPWIGVKPEALYELQHLSEADVVLWDAVLDPAVRQFGEYEEGI